MLNPQLTTPATTSCAGSIEQEKQVDTSVIPVSKGESNSALRNLDGPLKEDSSPSTLRQADFETINHVVQAALCQMVMPELNALQERLGIEPVHHWHSLKSPGCSDGSRPNSAVAIPESSNALHTTYVSSNHAEKDESSGDKGLPQTDSTKPAVDVEPLEPAQGRPLSPSASLRRWLQDTTNVHHRGRISELIQEAEEDTRVVKDIRLPVSSTRAPFSTCEHSNQSPDDTCKHSSASKLCTKPLKECLFEEAGVKLEDSGLPVVSSTADCRETICKSQNDAATPSATHEDVVMIDKLLQSALAECNLSDANSEHEHDTHQLVDHVERSAQEKTFTQAFEALRDELLSNMADLKEKLHTIPDLTERKVTSKLLRPARSILYGPREMTGANAICFTDYFKNTRPKKDRERLEQLLSSLLESVDGLKSDFREAEIQRLMGHTIVSAEKPKPCNTVVERRSSIELLKLATSPNRVHIAQKPKGDAASVRSFSTLEMMNSPIEEVDTKAFPMSKKFGDISIERPKVSPKGARSMNVSTNRHKTEASPRALSTVGKLQK